MKLINIFTIWYLGISFVVLLLGGVLIFKKLESEIDFEQGKELERQLDSYAQRIENGAAPKKIKTERLEIAELPTEKALVPLTVRDTIAWHDQLEQMERQLKASRSYLINGRHYYLSTYNIVIETSDITETVVQTMLAIFALLLIFTAITGRYISKKILSPFHKSLEKISTFSFQENKPLVFETTRMEEFEKLNAFLEKMSGKLLKDYRVMKEFSENISHEIQTPVAVMRGKLELLIDSPITDLQADLIQSAYQSNEKLTRIVHSLSVLAKLENREFEFSEKINFSSLLTQSTHDFEDLIDLKNISLVKQIEENVLISIHPYLAEILLNNLLTNAIKHNFTGGSIEIRLCQDHLIVKNSGIEPKLNTNELFERFKKGNNNSDSIGLGLSIVKQICFLSGFRIGYQFEKPFHLVKLSFR
ncbi:cell wall metabolism sensor histidine kinase WalK [Rhodonellum sp.]|uniref:sensor histidine kinase n=1 Tax=Rhodonellum sp. TaxID=2231180 RepID=UPI0027257FCE|nr:HAMP domain-containing sensor histidine kinase [Rhodonellum sp.]MDO9552284.1 HAMP domain-containing sensor histidine kinase [Rhodonellum sp.]